MLPVGRDTPCTPLRRQSWSAPGRLASGLVSECIQKTKDLTGQISRLTTNTRNERERQKRENIFVDLFVLADNPDRRSKSLIDLRELDLQSVVFAESIVDNLVTVAMEEVKKNRAKTCHQCHAPISDAVHSHVPSGVGICPLEHWALCPGGIKAVDGAKNRSWAPCPDMLDSSTSGSDDSTLSQSSMIDEISFKNGEKGGDPKHPIEVDVVVATGNNVEGETSTVEIESSDLESDEEAMQEELRIKREEIQKLQDAVKQKSTEDAEKARRDRRERRQLQFDHDKAELERQERLLRAQVVGHGDCENDPESRKRDLEKKVAEHEARQQRKAAAKLAKRMEEQQNAAGVSMASIRKVPEVRDKVDTYLNRLKEVAPTLSSDKTAGSMTTKTLPPATKKPTGSQSAKSNYVYVAELGQVVPIVGKVSDLPGSKVATANDVEDDTSTSSDETACSSDEDCDIEPGEGFRLVWKKHPNGDKFFEVVEDDRCLPEMEKTYVRDEATGRYECKLRPVRRGSRSATSSGRTMRADRSVSAVSKPSSSSNQMYYRDHRVRSGSTRSRPRKTPVALAKDDRMPSFLQTDSEKQGKVSQTSELVQYARDCPVHWTSKITTQNINVVLWSWAYVAQLLLPELVKHQPFLMEN